MGRERMLRCQRSFEDRDDQHTLPVAACEGSDLISMY